MNNYQKLKGMNFSDLAEELAPIGCPSVHCECPRDVSTEDCLRCWTHYLASPVVGEGTEEQEEKKETQEMPPIPVNNKERVQYLYTFGLDDEIVVACNETEIDRPSWRLMPLDLPGALQAFGVQQTLRGVFGTNMDNAFNRSKYGTLVRTGRDYVVATRDAFFAKADIWAWLWFYKADSDDWKAVLKADCLSAFKEATKWDEILQSETRLDEFINGFCCGAYDLSLPEEKHKEEEK